MPIYVDADACPKVIKEILYRAAVRAKIEVIVVANQILATPPSPFIKSIQVASGFDVADNEIVKRVNPRDLVITADIPLASLVVAKGAAALNPRGTLYTEANIRQRLAIRDLNDSLRSCGALTGGPQAIDKRDRMRFANALDRFIAQAPRTQ